MFPRNDERCMRLPRDDVNMPVSRILLRDSSLTSQHVHIDAEKA